MIAPCRANWQPCMLRAPSAQRGICSMHVRGAAEQAGRLNKRDCLMGAQPCSYGATCNGSQGRSKPSLPTMSLSRACMTEKMSPCNAHVLGLSTISFCLVLMAGRRAARCRAASCAKRLNLDVKLTVWLLWVAGGRRAAGRHPGARPIGRREAAAQHRVRAHLRAQHPLPG